jgi:hypothetical protein
MRRISIRTLMAFVLVSAVGLAALRNANELWAGMMLLVAMAALGGAVLGVILMRGRERAWWLGFAVFAGGYLALAFGPWLSDVFQPQLGTTHLLGHLRKLMFDSDALPLTPSEADSLLLQERRLEAGLANVKRVARNFSADPAGLAMAKKLQAIQGQLTANKNAGPRYEHFHGVGHSLFTLLAGLVGGTVAVWFWERRKRSPRSCDPPG